MKSTVFLVRTSDGASCDVGANAVGQVLDHSEFAKTLEPGEYVAIKLHVGEVNNKTHVPPEAARQIVDRVKAQGALAFLTETATLYRGERENAVKHIEHAVRQGFTIERTGAPFIMADGLAGDSEIDVPIDGTLFRSVKVAREARMADAIVVLSHMTGHIAAGFGATIKNLGMGLASRKGKMRQHSSIKPEVIPEKCVFCEKCLRWCPKDAISESNGCALIDEANCIGCGECLAVCRFGAIKFDWGADANWMQQAMAEHALGAVRDKKCFYVNYCIGMTKDCDCFTIDQTKEIPDIGVLASLDPVALDQASIDLTRGSDGRNLSELSHANIDCNVQLAHAESIGLGTRAYDLIELSW